jgi:hypothetical protein
MAFAPPDLLASVIAAHTARLTAAYGLTIQNRGTRVRVAPPAASRSCSRNLSLGSMMNDWQSNCLRGIPQSTSATQRRIVLGATNTPKFLCDFSHIPLAEYEPKVPPHTQDDHFTAKATATEQWIAKAWLTHFPYCPFRSNSYCNRAEWTLRGAHLLLQTRTKVLNNELDDAFRNRYPLFRAAESDKKVGS